LKTFEEAFSLVGVSKESEERATELDAVASKYREVLRDVLHSECFRNTVRAWKINVGHESCGERGLLAFDDMIVTVFTAGLITGIEMEKAE
jgi:hypothetical protein